MRRYADFLWVRPLGYFDFGDGAYGQEQHYNILAREFDGANSRYDHTYKNMRTQILMFSFFA